MLSTITNNTYYIGTRVRDKISGKIGTIYQINILGCNGLKVSFDDKTKLAYFGKQLKNLDIIEN